MILSYKHLYLAFFRKSHKLNHAKEHWRRPTPCYLTVWRLHSLLIAYDPILQINLDIKLPMMSYMDYIPFKFIVLRIHKDLTG